MAKKCSISPEQAYIDYLAIGAERSLYKLYVIYTANTPKPPSLDTLKSWSKKYHWQSKLGTDCFGIEYEARKKSTELHAEDLYIKRKEFYEMGISLVRKAYALLLDVKITDKETMENISLLCDAAIKCVQCAQSMKY